MKLLLNIWRQRSSDDAGGFVRYEVSDGVTGLSPDMSFLEMLDALNEQLATAGQSPIAFDSDCREGICGACGFVINGVAHGPRAATTVCQLHLRSFHDGEELYLEPWRSRAFPVLRDLIVDRGALDRIIAAGGFISAPTGAAPDARVIGIDKREADRAMDAAGCIGCGACVAACPNGAASLFTAAKIAHLGRLPQGQVERDARARGMVTQMDAEGFGSCTNIGECAAVCPKEIAIDLIPRMNRDLIRGTLNRGPAVSSSRRRSRHSPA
jgi:succinate dehydrogenase / fumarate reductase iron-sulfur subunit